MYRYYGTSSHKKFQIMDHGLEKKGRIYAWVIDFVQKTYEIFIYLNFPLSKYIFFGILSK